MSELNSISLSELCRLRDEGVVRDEEILDSFESRYRQHEPRLHAFVHRYRSGSAEGGILRSIPYATKANLAVRGQPQDCASRLLRGYRAPYDATVTRRLREAGAVVVGSTNMDEFGMGSTTEYSCYGPTRHPLDPERSPGGSSGGAAAAVATGMVAFALGTDTGGSVRQPAAHCGVFGLRPTWGRISRWGLTAFASSMDQVGILTRRAEDLPVVLGLLTGRDAFDATTHQVPTREVGRGDLRGLRVAFDPAGLGFAEAEVAVAFEGFVADLRSAGAEVRELSLPASTAALECYLLLSSVEAASNLARFDGTVYGRRRGGDHYEEMVRRTRSAGFGEEVKRRILRGTLVLAAGESGAELGRARRLRARIRREQIDALRGHDALLMPTTPAGPPRIGAPRGESKQTTDPDRFTAPASLAGLPALAAPAGRARNGLPWSVQWVGAPDADETLIAIAMACEAEGLGR